MIKKSCRLFYVVIGLLISSTALCNDEPIRTALAKIYSIDQLAAFLEFEASELRKTPDDKRKFSQILGEEIPRFLISDLESHKIVALLPIIDTVSTNAAFKVRQFYLERVNNTSLFIDLLKATPHMMPNGSKMLANAAQYNVFFFIRHTPTFDQISKFIFAVSSNYAVKEVLKYFFKELKPNKERTLKMLNSLQAKHVQYVFKMFDDRLNLTFDQIPDLLMERVKADPKALEVIVDHFIHKSETPEEFLKVLKLAPDNYNLLISDIESFVALRPSVEQAAELLNSIIYFLRNRPSAWQKITPMFLQSVNTAEDYIKMLSVFSDIRRPRFFEIGFDGICNITDQFTSSLQTFFDLNPSNEQIARVTSKDYSFCNYGTICFDRVNIQVRKHYLEQTQDAAFMIELLTIPPHLVYDRFVFSIHSLAQDYENKFLSLTQDKNLIATYDRILHPKRIPETQETSVYSKVTNWCSNLLLGKKG